jgi:hypothetical protein
MFCVDEHLNCHLLEWTCSELPYPELPCPELPCPELPCPSGQGKKLIFFMGFSPNCF